MSSRPVTRREFLRDSAASLAALTIPGIAHAQEYPAKPIKIKSIAPEELRKSLEKH
jgi:hypothetical protein